MPRSHPTSSIPQALPPRTRGKRIVLSEAFFARPAVVVARELLGKYLVRQTGEGEAAYVITETEAYVGPEDLAAHSSKGLTRRTKVMFGSPGHWYVYFTYGMHWMLNVVVEREGYPAAVLIRGVQDISGPARLAKRLAVTGALNGLPASPESGLWVEDRGVSIPKVSIIAGPRIGIAYAGSVWVAKPYRFLLSFRPEPESSNSLAMDKGC